MTRIAQMSESLFHVKQSTLDPAPMTRRELLRLLPVAAVAPIALAVGALSTPKDVWIEVPRWMSESEFADFEKGLAAIYPRYVIVTADVDGIKRVAA